MTTAAASDPASRPAPAPEPEPEPPARLRGLPGRRQVRFARRHPEPLLAVLAAVQFGRRVGVPSAWWDEAITREVVARSYADILRLARHVDFVHLPYYLLVHTLLGSGATLTGIRLVSVAAATGTAVLLVRIGRALGSVRVGVVAGLLWTAAPLASRYAQEARPYALVTLAATAATLALLRACRCPRQPGRWLLYGVLLACTGLLNLVGVLVVLPHLVQVLATGSRPAYRRWPVAVAAAMLVLAPLAVLSGGQREQVSWLARPDAAQLGGFFTVQFSAGLVPVGLVVLAVAALGRGTHRAALLLGLAWAVLPPVALWAVSQQHALYNWRYLIFALPGSALALASLATLLRLPLTVLLLAALVVPGWHLQDAYRYPASGHSEDIRGTARVVGDGARPGDAVIFMPASRRVVALGYPGDFRVAEDVALARSPAASGTLWGVEKPPGELAAALAGHPRVWVVTGAPRYGERPDPGDSAKARLLGRGYRLVRVTDRWRSYQVRLYVRDGG